MLQQGKVEVRVAGLKRKGELVLVAFPWLVPKHSKTVSRTNLLTFGKSLKEPGNEQFFQPPSSVRGDRGTQAPKPADFSAKTLN